MKTVADSRTEQVQILSQSYLNGYKRLFGGKLMEWIDIVAAVVSRRHSGRNVTTAVVDTLQFKKPAYANDTVVLVGYITHVGNTSMEVCVKTYVESLDGTRTLINKAYIVTVALDENEQPVKVPEIQLTTDEERAEWDAAIKRNDLRKLRKVEKF